MKTDQNTSCNPRLFLSDDERKKCCESTGKESGSDDQTKECLEVWKQKRDEADRNKKLAAACYHKAKQTHDRATSWEKRLEKWKEEAEDAHEQAIEVYDELSRFMDAVERTQTVETSKATRAVLCLTKSIFDDIDGLLHVSNSAEESKGELQRLKQWIDCKNTLNVNKKDKALSCIKTFEEQVTTANATQAELLALLLKILHTVNMLIAAVEKPKAEQSVGIKWQLKDLLDKMSGQGTAARAAREDMCKAEDESSPEQTCADSAVIPPTHQPPKSNLPILAMKKKDDSEVAGSAYYTDIICLYDAAQKAVETAKGELDSERKAHEAAESYYNGLNDAIKASEAVRPTK